MENTEIFWILAWILAFIAGCFYVVQILREKMKPERASWFIWSIVWTIVFVSYISNWASDSIWVPLAFAIIPMVIFLLSLKYGIGWLDKFDRYVLWWAGISLLVWWFSGSAFLWLLSISFVDIAWYFPTIKKVVKDPLSEDKSAWVIWTLGCWVNIFAVEKWVFSVYFTPLYLFLFWLIVTLLLFKK